MKKKISLLFGSIACAATLALGLAACNHEHTYSSDWSTSATEHWHAATCEHTDEKDGVAAHAFGDWSVTKEPTETEKGSKKRTCSECNYTEVAEIDELEHVHTYATTWSSDKTNHWHAATCSHTDEKNDLAAHTFGDWTETKAATHTTKGSKKRACTTCKYEETEEIDVLPDHSFETNWTYNLTQHWHAATCGHDVKDGVADHTYGTNNLCTVCGAKKTDAVLTTPNVADTGYTEGSSADITIGGGKSFYVQATCDKAGEYTFIYEGEGVENEEYIDITYSYKNVTGGDETETFYLPVWDMESYGNVYYFTITLYGAADVYFELSAADADTPFTGTFSYEYAALRGNWLTLDEDTNATGLSMWNAVRYYFIAPKNGMYVLEFDPDAVDVSLVRDGGDGDSETLTNPDFSLSAGEVVAFELYQMGSATQATITLIFDHEHKPAAQWQYDGTYHWNVCTHDGCTEQFNKTVHDSTDTETPCSVCGGKHVHTWSENSWIEWKYDDDVHYHYTTCTTHGEIRKDEAAHVLDENFVCTAECGYAHSHTYDSSVGPYGYLSDETKHWHLATCEDHAGLKYDEEEHAFRDGICTDCMYYEPTQNTVTGVTAENPVSKEIALTDEKLYERIDFTVTVAGKYTLTYVGEKTVMIKYTYPENRTVALPSNGSRTLTIDLSGITESITVKFSVSAYGAANGSLNFILGELPAAAPVQITTDGATLDLTHPNGATLTLKAKDDQTANGFVAGNTYKFTLNNAKAFFSYDGKKVSELKLKFSGNSDTLKLITADGTPLSGVTVTVEDLGVIDDGPVFTLGSAKTFDNVGFDGKVYTLEITEAGDYTATFTGVEEGDVYFAIGTRYEYGDIADPISPNDGVYTLAAGTYRVFIAANNGTVSGTVTIAKATA